MISIIFLLCGFAACQVCDIVLGPYPHPRLDIEGFVKRFLIEVMACLILGRIVKVLFNL